MQICILNLTKKLNVSQQFQVAIQVPVQCCLQHIAHSLPTSSTVLGILSDVL